MSHSELGDMVWMLLCAALVMLMQGGFCFLECGFSRAKNSTNVAIKNLIDFCIAAVAFWTFGYGLMFGATYCGLIGTSQFCLNESVGPRLLAFFLFQLVFCGTSTTIISGAVAERMRFVSYLVVSLIMSALIYPVFGHWVWGGAAEGVHTGWLNSRGFIDFAGSTAVHSVGAWVSLAAVLIIGPRLGRFDADKPPIQGHNIPMATLGAMLLWFGWFGFNGGSTLAVNSTIPLILVNTNLSAACGGLAALGFSWLCERRPAAGQVINGVIAGLVGITASCHLVSPLAAMLIGAVAGILCVSGTYLLAHLKIDDAVGAIPVHGFSGVWGTLAVALFGDLAAFGPGIGRWDQLGIQASGVAACFGWSFGGGFALLWILNRFMPMRVSEEAELQGLNVSEHGDSTELMTLLANMERQRELGDFSHQVAVEPHTEVGQIAIEYNRVMDKVSAEILAREMAVQELRVAEEKYRGMFENAIEGIFQTTPDGRYRTANPALLRMYGYESLAELSQNVCDIQHQLYVDPERRDGFVRLMTLHDHVTNFESQIYRKNREIIWISENARAIRDASGQILYYEGTVEDITERKQSAELYRQMEAAEASSQAKSHFLAKMSHEIRTPLNGVIGMLELIAGTSLDSKQQRYVSIAKSSADSLLSLINDILDISKIEAGKLELEHIEFDLPMLLEDVTEIFGHRCASKGLELSCHVLPEVPSAVRGDPERLRQILINLINNAMKFTEQGEVGIRTSLVHSSDQKTRVRFAIWDTGMGIPANRRDRLFASFSQVDASTTRKHGGTGLGLAICKQLVELMKGILGVESTEGEGSTFWFEIPLEPVQEGARRPREVPGNIRGLRILAVDDTETNLEILRDQVSSWGFNLTTTSDAESALQLLREAAASGEPFKLAILDQQMPDMDGLELTDSIKSDSLIRNTTLLMLTSLDSVVEGSRMQSIGLAGCLAKPIRQSRLFDAIIDAVGSDVLPVMAPDDESPAVPRNIQLATCRILVADDNEINRMVTAEVLRSEGFTCDLARNGREALEAVVQGNYDVVLMDCQMPEMDGFEATSRIRKMEADGTMKASVAQPLSIVALTANAIKGDRERCLSAGMDDYVTKPIDRRKLIAAVVSCLERRAAHSQISDHGAAPAAFAPDTDTTPSPPVREDWLLDLCIGDEAFMSRLLLAFGDQVRNEVRSIDQAVAESDMPRVLELAHSLKGSSSNVSADGVCQAATALEKSARAGRISSSESSLAQLKSEADRFLDFIEHSLRKL